MSEQNKGMYQIPPHADNGVSNDNENNPQDVVLDVLNENIVSLEDFKKKKQDQLVKSEDIVDVAFHQATSENIISFDELKKLKAQRIDIDEIYSQNISEDNRYSVSDKLLETMSECDVRFYNIIRKPGPIDITKVRELLLSESIVPQLHIYNMLNAKKSKKNKKAA